MAEDSALFKSFILWATDLPAPKGANLEIVEQRLPGESELDEVEVDKRGLPDAWIFAESGWALLIESKVSSSIDANQISRHLRTAERRGFADSRLVCLSVAAPNSKLPKKVTHRTWSSLYRWATAHMRTSDWARRLTGYMEVAERRMLADEYLNEGTLTTFAGIQFDAENPYGYLEAKRLLKLLMEELRKRQLLARQLGANLVAPGRSAITGTQADSVWDYIPLVKAQDKSNFTSHPHLTLAILRDRVIVQITVPNGLDRSLRRALLDGGYDAFKAMVSEFHRNTAPVLKFDTGARAFVEILQRHYPTQRSTPISDAELKFDPRTALGNRNGVKMQEEWLKAAFASFSNRRSNLQLGIGLGFHYRSSSSVKQAQFADVAERSWLACKPVLATMGLVSIT